MKEQKAHYPNGWIRSENELKQPKNWLHLCRGDWLPAQDQEEQQLRTQDVESLSAD